MFISSSIISSSFFIIPPKNKLSILSWTNSICGLSMISLSLSLSLFLSIFLPGKLILFLSKLFLLINCIIYSSLIFVDSINISSAFWISFSAFFLQGRFLLSFSSLFSLFSLLSLLFIILKEFVSTFWHFSSLNKFNICDGADIILSMYKLSVFCFSKFFLITRGSIYILQFFSISIKLVKLSGFILLPSSIFVFSINKLLVNCFCNGSLSFDFIIKLTMLSIFKSLLISFFSKVNSSTSWISYSGIVNPSITILSITSYSNGFCSLGSIYKLIFFSMRFIDWGFLEDLGLGLISRLMASACNMDEKSFCVESISTDSNFWIEFWGFSKTSINKLSTNWFCRFSIFFSGFISIFISCIMILLFCSFFSSIGICSNNILSIVSDFNGAFWFFRKCILSISSIS